MDLKEIQNKQEKYISQSGLTNSKFRSQFVEACPTHLTEGRGAYVKDTNGKDYIDLICGLGSVSLGYSFPAVNAEVSKQLQKGVSFSLPTPLEVGAAEFLLTEFLTKYDAVKYLKTGAEATSGAVTIARAATGRQWITTVGYHGHHANWVSTKPNNSGIGDTFRYREWQDTYSILELSDLTDVAAVIIEPIHLEHSESNIQMLFKLKEKCKKYGTLLIFDEIVCGTRIPEVFISTVIEPDLVCIGKGIANGFPLCGIVGKKDLMHETPFFISSTFAGETMSLTAHLATMKFIKNNPPKELYESANRMMKKAKEAWAPFVQLNGYGTRGFFEGNFSLLQQEAVKNRLLLGKSWFYNYSHMEIERIIQSAIEDIASKLFKAKLEGRPIKETFKRA